MNTADHRVNLRPILLDIQSDTIRLHTRCFSIAVEGNNVLLIADGLGREQNVFGRTTRRTRMTQLTRSEKVERHFRNSVREKILGLMSVLDPGEQLLWGSLEYNELLKAARDRIDAELLNDENFEETPEMKCATTTFEQNPASLQDPGYHARQIAQAALALPESAVRGSER